MASLRFENGRPATPEEVGTLASAFGLVVEHRPVPDDLARCCSAVAR